MSRMASCWLTGGAVVACLSLIGVALAAPAPGEDTTMGALRLTTGGRPIDLVGLPNVVRLSERLYSGGVPHGAEGFRTLQELGIRTVLTVDGAPPEVDLARRYGLRYVHLPFGYDACPTPTANAIAKAVRELPGPVYIHCHHGKHRSPTAAAMVRIALDGISPADAAREMERAGTGKNYLGLYADVRAYRPPTPAELDRMKVAFTEVAETEPMVDAMVKIEVRFDRLLALQKGGWRGLDTREGVDKAAHEALQLQELYTELNRTREVREHREDYRRWMRQGETAGKSLEGAIRERNQEVAGTSLGQLAVGCASCHAKYRNVPQRR